MVEMSEEMEHARLLSMGTITVTIVILEVENPRGKDLENYLGPPGVDMTLMK